MKEPSLAPSGVAPTTHVIYDINLQERFCLLGSVISTLEVNNHVDVYVYDLDVVVRVPSVLRYKVRPGTDLAGIPEFSHRANDGLSFTTGDEVLLVTAENAFTGSWCSYHDYLESLLKE